MAVALLALLPLWHAEGLEQQDFSLENGLRVILVREPKAPVAIAQIWYRVGALDEPEGKSGLSHMLEHMMFQGTPAVPAGEFHRIIGRNGGENNASTSRDHTSYYIKLASDRIALALDLEADRMRHLSLRETEFRSENLVVQEERRTRTDADPNGRFLEKFQAKAYGSHPYGRPVIGWMTEIQQYTTEDLRAWYHRYYVPNNAVLVVVGDIELASMAQQVRDRFSSIPAAPPPTTSLPEHPPPWERDGSVPTLPQAPSSVAQRLEVTDPAVTLPMWYGGYPTPSLLTVDREDVFALDLLATLLGSGSNSRLYKRLVLEEGLAVSVSASYGGYARSWELFTLSAAPKMDDGQDVGAQASSLMPRLEQAILAEVRRLAQEPVGERELQRAKNSMMAHHIFARDSLHELASVIGLLAASNLDWPALVDDFPQKIAAVRAEDVQRVAARYLRPDLLTVGVLKP
ncbi:MAG: insulinase family protein [Magnetococcus sp. MYC-9]